MQIEQALNSGNFYLPNPGKSLNKSFLKVNPKRTQIGAQGEPHQTSLIFTRRCRKPTSQANCGSEMAAMTGNTGSLTFIGLCLLFLMGLGIKEYPFGRCKIWERRQI